MTAPKLPDVSCTRWLCRPGKPCAECRRAALDIAAPDHRAFYERTEHCGACGQPGSYCVCTIPCGCHDLHPVGSGLDPDALSRFAETDIDQPGLFA